MKKNTEFVRENNTFIRQDMRNRSIKTKYQFKDLDGKEYNIYISCRKNALLRKQLILEENIKFFFLKILQEIFLKNLNLIKIKLLKKKVELFEYSTPVERIVA